MVFPPLWGKKWRRSEHARASYPDSFFARPRSAPVGARRKESSGTELVIRKILLFSYVIIFLLSCCYFVTMSHWKHNVHLTSLCLCRHVVISLGWTGVHRVVLRQNKSFPGCLLSLYQNELPYKDAFRLHFMQTELTYFHCRKVFAEGFVVKPRHKVNSKMVYLEFS